MTAAPEIISIDSLRGYIDKIFAEGRASLQGRHEESVALMVCYALQEVGLRPGDEFTHEAIDALLAVGVRRPLAATMFTQRWRHVAKTLWGAYRYPQATKRWEERTFKYAAHLTEPPAYSEE